MSCYEPSPVEVFITRALHPVTRVAYRSYIAGLNLTGRETVLDYGTGSGAGTRYLAERLARGGGRLTSVDVSRRWQAVARKTLSRFDNVDYALGPLWELGLPEGAYDIVFVHYALHDVPTGEHDLVLAEFRRLLKPGGRVLIREPARPEHGITAPALLALFETAGFKTVSVSPGLSRVTGPYAEGVFATDGV